MGLIFCQSLSYGQSGEEPASGKLTGFPFRLLDRIHHKTAGLNDQLTWQTEKYLARLAKREARMQKKLYKIDSTAAKNLFSNSQLEYADLARKLRQDTGSRSMSNGGEYQPYTDSLKGSLAFLQKNPQLLVSKGTALVQLQNSVGELQALQAKLQDADQIKQFIRERKERIGQCLSKFNNLPASLNKDVQGMGRELTYYSLQVREYKQLLNSPDAMEQKALSLLNKLPAFQTFMKENGALAGLFNLPGNYGDPQALVGLQTRTQINQLIQSQVATGGAGGAAALQGNLQSAQSQLDGYKDKLNKLGGGSGDIDMPNFKPNDQKTKTFLKRLEFGVNFQTSRNNQYYPTVADLGASVGYKLGGGNIAGLGFSTKIGLGNGWNHIAFTGNGLSVRSFLDIKVKGSFFLSGGLEFNRTTPFSSVRQLREMNYWTRSGLLGVSKTVSVKSRVFKKTKLSLLWDYLSYSQKPNTQAILFRVGYNF
ncbi:hypothetical protein ACX0G9_26910 [Flavitalea flava]